MQPFVTNLEAFPLWRTQYAITQNSFFICVQSNELMIKFIVIGLKNSQLQRIYSEWISCGNVAIYPSLTILNNDKTISVRYYKIDSNSLRNSIVGSICLVKFWQSINNFHLGYYPYRPGQPRGEINTFLAPVMFVITHILKLQNHILNFASPNVWKYQIYKLSSNIGCMKTYLHKPKLAWNGKS